MSDEPDEDGFFIPIASDVPDLGTADTIPEFWEWCNKRREGLRRLRLRMGEPAPAAIALAEFRAIPEIVHQCRAYLTGFGVESIPERFSFADLPRAQTPSGSDYFPSAMEEFIVWASRYRLPGHGIMGLLGRIEDLLSWAMGWCRQQPSCGGGSEEQAPALVETTNRKAEGMKPKRTKPPLEKSNPKKANIYNRIMAEHRSGKKPAAIVKTLKDDKDFKELVKGTGLNLNVKLVRAALAWGNDPKRKNQESPPV